jgi:beta-glucanase (GH16 family)
MELKALRLSTLLAFAGFALALGSIRLGAATPDNWTPGAGWSLVWADEFNGNAVDPANWGYDLGGGGWGNHELETYDQASATVQNGELVITAQKNPNGTYSSARLKTQGKKSWMYGKVAARLRLPKGQGLWPAFWMLGDSVTTAGWPASGEIDIMEMIGGGEDRDDSTYGTLHWDASGHASTGTGRAEIPDPQILADDYHVFEIEWDPANIIWKRDGVEFGRSSIDTKQWPTMTEFHAKFFIILNLAVGGDWPGNPDSSTVFPQTLSVDWVRVYSNDALAGMPAFTTQPMSQTITAGQPVTFTVAASGAPAPTFQWQKNSVNIAGATDASYRIASVTTSDAANYRAIASNSFGNATSDSAALTVVTSTTPPSTPNPPAAPGGGGGGGGGAPSVSFLTALAVLWLVRFAWVRWSPRSAAG